MSEYNALNFNADVENFSDKYNPLEDLGRTVKFVLIPKGEQITDMSTALTEATWATLFEQKAARALVSPYLYSAEDNTEDPTYQDFTGGDSLKVRDGKIAERYMCEVSMADAAKLRTWNNNDWEIALIDENGNILGTSPDGTVFRGFSMSSFEVETIRPTAGDTRRMLTIYMKLRDISEWMDRPAVLRPLHEETGSFDPRTFRGLTDVELTVESASSSEIVVKAEAYKKGVLLDGFVEADFVLLDSGGSAVSSSGFTDNGDGTYTLTGTFTTGGTINLDDPVDLSQRGYESTGAKDVTF